LPVLQICALPLTDDPEVFSQGESPM
jgi:hypothetical protein